MRTICYLAAILAALWLTADADAKCKHGKLLGGRRGSCGASAAVQRTRAVTTVRTRGVFMAAPMQCAPAQKAEPVPAPKKTK